MALNSVLQTPRKQSGGKGGLFGKIFGGIAGGIAGAFMGGPAGALMGASAGAGLGGTVGNIADPVKVKDTHRVPLQTASEKMPEMDFMQLQEAQKALLEDPSLDFSYAERDELNKNVFEPAINQFKTKFKAR